MKTLANTRTALIAIILTTLGLTTAANADVETVTVLATQTSLINVEIDKIDLTDDLAENFSDEIRMDLDERLPLELDQLIASAQ